MTDIWQMFPGNDQDRHNLDQPTECSCGVHIFALNGISLGDLYPDPMYGELYVHPMMPE